MGSVREFVIGKLQVSERMPADTNLKLNRVSIPCRIVFQWMMKSSLTMEQV
jgi:hypothetical protein